MREVSAHLPAGIHAPEGLLAAFWAYERALLADDVEMLDALFEAGPDTLRGDQAGLLRGHEPIAAFRAGRARPPARVVLAVEVRPLSDDAALVLAVTAPRAGGRGLQTQVWRRGTAGWRVAAAHVSAPAPAIAGATWRVLGAPLVAGAPEGPLAGQSVAVKDLFAVAGYPTGAGVPTYLAGSAPAPDHAPTVAALLAAGAHVQGIAQTDELAFSIAGRNPHYGTPPNPAVVGGLPGGSSSGPAAAVALGQASIGLGTDTGGSIRVPASYQGLWGLRTTHGAVSTRAVVPLAPGFDTVGWLTRDAPTLRAAARATLAAGDQRDVGTSFALAPALARAADEQVRLAFESAVGTLTSGRGTGDVATLELVGELDPETLLALFRTVQGAQAWRCHGAWVDAHPGALGPDAAGRFAWARTITPDAAASAARALASAGAQLDAVLGERILLVPSASSAAPAADASAQELERVRAATGRLTCIAGITGRPALSVPVLSVPVPGPESARAASVLPAPVGLCLVGPRFTDLALVATGERLALALTGRTT